MLSAGLAPQGRTVQGVEPADADRCAYLAGESLLPELRGDHRPLEFALLTEVVDPLRDAGVAFLQGDPPLALAYPSAG